MASFTDTEGRIWVLRITVGNRIGLKAVGFDVDLVAIEPEKLAAAFTSVEILAKAIWSLCEAEAGKRQVTYEQFADAIDGPVRFAAATALEEAVMDFTQPPPIATKLKSRREGAMDKVMTAAMAQIDAVLDGSIGKPGNSPAPPEFPPPIIPSES